MEMLQCSNCNKLMGFKRHLGLGTFIGVLLTCGLWVLAIPFYPKRCIVCGSESGKKANMTVVLICLGLIVACFLMIQFEESHRTPEAPRNASGQTNTQPEAPANWEVDSKTNPVSGEMTVVASLKDHDEQDIIVRQIGKKLDCYIKTGEFLETVDNMDSGTSTVQYKFDDGKVIKQSWGLSGDNTALFYPGNPKAFLEQMRKAKTLSFEFKPSDKVPETITFDVGGFPDTFK